VFAINWFGILAPPNTPASITGLLNSEINSLLAQDVFKQRLLRYGAEPFAQSVADYGRFIAEDTKRWATVVANAGVPKQ
jgi:tripartite-type tricarboxylate transporter receptor subunit TctC